MQNQSSTLDKDVEFDYKKPPHENESWDQYLVRSLKRDRESENKLMIIAGPCQIESKEQGIRIASHCAEISDKYGFDYYYKSSFDKANRTSIGGTRGLGFESGLELIRDVAEHSSVKTCVDFHEAHQIDKAFSRLLLPNIIQIPAFLCRQTDLLLKAKEYAGGGGRKADMINVKKGQFLAPWDIDGILSKTGTEHVMITERGTSFGYNTLVVDYTGLDYMLNNYSVPIVFDGTHAVQKPGGQGNSSGGNRDYVPGLCRAAAAIGVNNFFVEVHEDPDNAPSDGPNMLNLKQFEDLLKGIKYHANG